MIELGQACHSMLLLGDSGLFITGSSDGWIFGFDSLVSRSALGTTVLGLDAKYWKYIDFVGHFETLPEDARRLLEQIGAWEDIGHTGWGKYGNASIFEKPPHNQPHVTNFNSKASSWYTQALGRRVEEFYARDYNLAILNYTKTNLTSW